MQHYILKGREVVEADLLTWAEFFENHENRRVAEDFTLSYRISTVFLGVDHGFGDGPPLVFETMSFELEESVMEFMGKMHTYHESLDEQRYSTYDEALAGHKAMVRRYRRAERKALRELERIGEKK